MAIIIGGTSAGTLGTVTMGELKAIVQAEGGYDTDTTGAQTLMIRDVLRRLYGARRWKFLQQENVMFSASVANQGIVSLASVGRGIMLDSVRIGYSTDAWDLDPHDLDTILDYRHLDNTTGAPSSWAKQGDGIVVWPIPDKTYPLKINMYAYTTLPNADGDSILWPEAHIAVVKYGTMMELARRQRDESGYDRIKLDFTEATMEQLRDEGVDERQAADRVLSWMGWDRFGF